MRSRWARLRASMVLSAVKACQACSPNCGALRSMGTAALERTDADHALKKVAVACVTGVGMPAHHEMRRRCLLELGSAKCLAHSFVAHSRPQRGHVCEVPG